MNAHRPIDTVRSYEPVSFKDWSYTMDLSSFPDGCVVRTDALSGRQWAFGRNKLGIMIGAPLGVRLCQGCDKPIVDSICPDCDLVFTGEPE